jgi:copper chaperone CopZ
VQSAECRVATVVVLHVLESGKVTLHPALCTLHHAVMAHLRFNIAGMTGPACQQKIEARLAKLPGIYSAVVCLDRGYADVEYGEDRLTAEQVMEAINKTGYRASLGG